MREERHLLGQMMNQVHQQQQELKELQNQLTTKIDSNSESLKQSKHHKRLSKKHKHLKLKYWLNQQIKLKSNVVTEDKADSKDSKVAGVNTSTDAKTDTKAENAGDGNATKVDKEDQISATEAIEKPALSSLKMTKQLRLQIKKLQ